MPRRLSVLALVSALLGCTVVEPQPVAGAIGSLPIGKPGTTAKPRQVAERYFCRGPAKTWGVGSDSGGYVYQGNRSKRDDAGKCQATGEVGKLVGLTAAHNQARADVGVAALQWSPELAAYAQAWANQLAANNCTLAHRTGDSYGENLFWKSHGATSSEVVAQWAAEKATYDHPSNSCSGTTCGHYTQIVWSSTTELGCGMAARRENR